MKKILATGLTLFSLNSFAQSYLVLQNGVTLTIDKAGFVYDFKHFFLPYKVQVNGGQYLISDDKLNTVDTAGFLYKKDLEVDKVKGKGSNYFINDNYHLYTIDESGFYYKYDKEKSFFKKASVFGGNFFVVKVDEKKKVYNLVTINSKGNYFKTSVPGLNPMDITTPGGNWFINKAGVVHTVSSEGYVFAKPEVKVGALVRKGGNFLVDDSGKIFTVSQEGYLTLPGLPMAFNLSDMIKLGSNYLIDSEGRMFVVDASGNVLEHKITEHDVRNASVLSL